MTCAIEPALLQRVDARDVRLARREPAATIAVRVAARSHGGPGRQAGNF